MSQVRVGFDPLGQPEVGNVRPAVDVDQDVGRLEIAMQHAPAMGKRHRAANRGQQRGRLARRHRSLGQPLGQRRAGDILHGEEGLARLLADFVNRHDARMVELSGRFGFGPKACQVGAAGQAPRKIIFTATIRSRLICLPR